MPGGLPRIHDTPRHLARVADERTSARRTALHRALGRPRVVVVTIDGSRTREAAEADTAVLAPLTRSLEPCPELTGAWVRVVAQGWELVALEACRAAGLDGAVAIELDVSVGTDTTRSPSLDEVLQTLGPGFRTIAVDATHADPETGATLAASVVLAPQPNT
jgi:hypothetical protein